MAEGQILVASAVILPDTAEQLSPPLSSKRRQSSVSEVDSKRPRLSEDGSPERANGESTPPTRSKAAHPEREEKGKLEERKRGKRLFGALLGTLAQSSSSTAQKRRVDIEKKQQAKLKLQAEEHDEKKKQRLEALTEIRRQEQKKYDRQSMQIRHSNLLATAHFLQTKAEPKLYYKPWALLPDEEAKITFQIVETEATLEREAAVYKAEESAAAEDAQQQETDASTKPANATFPDPETVGQVANNEGPFNPLQDFNANHLITAVVEDKAEPVPSTETPIEVPKDHVDDGGDVIVEGEEDTVIY